jgi:uncharacterized oxidoreductase
MSQIVVSAAGMRRIASAILAAAGCARDEADRVAHYLVLANLTGHDSHGVGRIPRYLEWMDKGWLKPGQTPSVIAETDAMVLLDGHFGFGQTLGPRAVAIGVRKAEAAGTTIVGLRHSGHLGRIGDFAEMAADAGLVSIHFVNVAGSPLVAPFGARERRMGTNPLTIGVPVPGAPHLILDFATSAVAEGKIMVAYSGGPPVPAASLIGADGRPTADPAGFYGPKRPGHPPDAKRGEGAIRAMGEHKGSGLSLMIELLAGALMGSSCAGPLPRPVNNGMLSIYLKPEAFAGRDAFAAEASAYLDYFRSARPAEGFAEVLTPGEPERRMRARREAEGLPMPEEIWNLILAAGERVGLARDALTQLERIADRWNR